MIIPQHARARAHTHARAHTNAAPPAASMPVGVARGAVKGPGGLAAAGTFKLIPGLGRRRSGTRRGRAFCPTVSSPASESYFQVQHPSQTAAGSPHLTPSQADDSPRRARVGRGWPGLCVGWGGVPSRRRAPGTAATSSSGICAASEARPARAQSGPRPSPAAARCRRGVASHAGSTAAAVREAGSASRHGTIPAPSLTDSEAAVLPSPECAGPCHTPAACYY